MVEEKLGEEAEVLRVRLVLAAVDLEEGNLWRVQLIRLRSLEGFYWTPTWLIHSVWYV